MLSSNLCVILFHGVVGQSIEFKTLYAKRKVSGTIGHSVTFTWKFSGAVDKVTWGLTNEVGTRVEKKLVSLDVSGKDVLPAGSVPEAYRDRVNGTRTVDPSSDQANFTLYNVAKDDERLYGCLLTPDDPNFQAQTDFVQLVVLGMYLLREL